MLQTFEALVFAPGKMAVNEAYNGVSEEREQDTGEDLELDVVALCCDFTEYSNAIEAAADYGFTSELEAEDYEDVESYEDAKEDEALEWLQDRTEVISFDGGLIIQNF